MVTRSADRTPGGRDPGASPIVLVAVVYLLTAAGHLHSFDAGHQLSVAESIVHDGTFETTLPGGIEGAGGRRYIQYPIGPSLLFVPAVAAGDLVHRIQPSRPAHQYAVFLASFVSPLAGLLTCAILYRIGRRTSGSARASAAATLVYALATIQWPYAHSTYDVAAAGLFLLWSVDRLDLDRPLEGGLILAAGLVVRLSLAAVAPAFALHVLLAPADGWRRRLVRLAAFVGPLGGALAVHAGYNWLRFGDALRTGYEGRIGFGTPWLEGVSAHLVSPGRSLFLYSPILILTVGASLRALVVRPERRALLLLAGPGLYFLLHVRTSYLQGDWDWGPRYLVPLTGLLALPLASLLRRPEGALRAAVVLLAAIGFGVQILGVALDSTVQVELLHEERSFGDRIWSLETSAIGNHARRLPGVLTGTAPFPRARAGRGGPRPAVNSLDFWWVYLWRIGFSRPALVGALSVLVLVGLVAGRRVAGDLSGRSPP